MKRPSLRQLLDTAHDHGVYVSTGGWIEHVLAQVSRSGGVLKGGVSAALPALPALPIARLQGRDMRLAGTFSPWPCIPPPSLQGRDAVRTYLAECQALGFDVVEVSTGFVSLPTEDLVRLVRDVQAAGLKAKPEVGVGGWLGVGRVGDVQAARPKPKPERGP